MTDSISHTLSASRRAPIALFVNSFGGGGAEKNVVLIANGMIERGHDVDVLVEHDRGSYRQQLSPQARVVSFNTSSPFSILSQLCTYFRATPPRVFFAHLEKPALLAIVAGILSGYHKVIPCLHVDLNSYAKIDHQMRRQLLRVLLGVFYRFSAKVVSVSEGCKESLAPLMGRSASKIVTVYNGFDLDKLRASSREAVDHPLVINKIKPSFIGCGRLSEQKNFAMLIRAFAKVRQQRDASLIILGEGPQREMLEQLAATLGVKDDVHLPGFQANPFAWFGKSDAFVLSSKSEGLANVVIEAMATGARMICTDCPSGPSEILAKGKYGVLVPVDGEDAMANAMLDVLDGKGAQLPQAEVQAYLDGTFSFALMIGGYLKVAADVAGDGVV